MAKGGRKEADRIFPHQGMEPWPRASEKVATLRIPEFYSGKICVRLLIYRAWGKHSGRENA